MLITNKKWWAAAGVRALKTMAEGIVALIGANMVSVTELDWPQILGISATMAIVALCTCIVRLPEIEVEEVE